MKTRAIRMLDRTNDSVFGTLWFWALFLQAAQERRLIIVLLVAFDRGDDGELFPAFGPADQQSKKRSIRTARALASKHAGVIAWSRDADPAIGEYGPPTTLFVSGEVPDME